uniref:protein AAR2 homolog n=1 Tax=Styela clava TaxID=7725 RepID=UPI00193A875E|nr:protein AAR2 homolog [Styela clava]
MDQGLAKKLFEEGAFLILVDMPKGTEFGMDWNSWITGPKFKGVKMIPPGLHFIFYSSNGKHGGHSSPRSGFFHFFKQREIFISHWDVNNEEIQFSHKSVDEMNSLRDNLKNLDKNLAPYPYDTLEKWVSLTDWINNDVMVKLQPENGKIQSVPELISESNVSPSGKEMSEESVKVPRSSAVDEDGLPILKPKPGTEIKFSMIPKQWYPPNATPHEISKHSVDSSYILGQIIKNSSQPEDLLGELQFAFICFVLGQVLDAFEQWKSLVNVLCSCDDLLKEHQKLYGSLLTVFYHQLNEIPKDFFVDVVSSNNFLVSTLTILFSNLQTEGIDASLQKRGKQFQKYLTKKFKWNFKSEPDDWAPVVVEI